MIRRLHQIHSFQKTVHSVALLAILLPLMAPPLALAHELPEAAIQSTGDNTPDWLVATPESAVLLEPANMLAALAAPAACDGGGCDAPALDAPEWADAGALGTAVSPPWLSAETVNPIDTRYFISAEDAAGASALTLGSATAPDWFTPAGDAPSQPSSDLLLDAAQCPVANDVSLDITPPPYDVSRGNVAGDVYTVTIQNNGVISATEIGLRIDPNKGFYYLGGTAVATSSALITTVPISDPGTTAPDVAFTLQPTGTVTATSLLPGEQIVFSFVLATTANAQSGQMLRAYLQSGDPTPGTCKSAEENIQTVRGNLAVIKAPATQEGSVGEMITWTVTLMNTGLGNIYDAVFTDTMGAGLTNLQISPAPAAVDLAPNENQDYTVTAVISACGNLTNTVAASWSIGNNDATATGANPVRDEVDVVLALAEPDITIEMGSIPDINLCGALDVTIPVTLTNNGGTARNLRLNASGGAVSLTNLDSANWSGFTYIGGTPAGTMLPGAVITFDMRVTSGAICSTEAASIRLEPVYKDACLLWQDTGTAVTDNAAFGDDAPTLHIEKTGPSHVDAGDIFTYTVNLNGENQQSILGDVVVTDTLPAFLVVQAITPSSGSVVTNGNQVVWNVPTTGSGAYAASLQMRVRLPATGQGFCAAGGAFTNNVTAVAPVCPDCPSLTATDEVRTYVDDNLGENQFDKTISDVELCSADPMQQVTAVMSVTTGVTWTHTLYTDTLGQGAFLQPLSVVPGSTQVLIDGVDRTADVTVTLGAPYTVDFSAIGGYSPTAHITITYNIIAAAGSIVGDAPQQTAFLFSQMQLGGSGQSCTGGQIGQMGDWVTLSRGDLAVTVAPDVIDSCREENVTLTVSGANVGTLTDNLVVTFTAAATDIFTPTTAVYGGAFAGQSPTVVRNGSVVTFTFPAGLDVDGSGTISFPLFRPCSTVGDLTADLSYQDRCHVIRTDADREGTTTHVPDVTLFTTPDRYTVVSTETTWRFYASSSGTADAHDVTITNTLPIGHAYRDHTLTSSTLTPAQLNAIMLDMGTTPAGNQVLTFTIPTLPVGGRVQVDVWADVNTCAPLETLHIALFDDCNQTGGVCGGRQEGEVTFVKAPTALNSSNDQSANLPLCEVGTIELVVKNSSPLSEEYKFQITDILTNATYIADTGRVTVTNAAGDVALDSNGQPLANVPFTPTLTSPVSSTQLLTWELANYTPGTAAYDVLNVRAARDEIHIFFDVKTGCGGVNAEVSSSGSARDVCDQLLTFSEDSASLVVVTPELAATKQVRNVSEGGGLGGAVFAGVGDVLVWEIVVTNNGRQRVTNLFVNDQMPDEFEITAVSPITSSQSGDPPYLRWHETGGQTLAANGGSITYQITTTVGSNACTVSTENVADASYACGVDDICLTIPVTATASIDTKPAFTVDAVDADLDQCRGGDITINFANSGARAQNVVLTYTLPSGLQYNGLLPGANPTPTSQPPLGASGTLTWEYAVIHSQAATNTLQFSVVNQTGVCAAPGVNGGNVADMAYEDTCGRPHDDVAADSNAITVRASDISNAAQTPITRTIEYGETYTWTITIPNSGDSATNNMLVTETLGVGWTAVSASAGAPGGAVPVINGNEVTWDVGSLPAAETWTAVVTATTVDAATDYRTTLAVQTACSDGSCLQTTAVPNHNTPLQAFDKQIGQTPVSIGESFTYTLTADFWGAVSYSNVLLTDTLPQLDNTLVFSITDVQIANENSGVNVWQHGPLNGDTFTVTTNASGAVAGPDFVTITVTGLISNEIAADNNDLFTNRVDLTYVEDGQPYAYARARDGLIREPLLEIVKTAAPTTNLDAGDEVTYTLTIDDLPAGTADAYDLTVVDVIPTDLTYKPGSLDAPGAATALTSDQHITVTYDTFPVGAPARTITYVATLDVTAQPRDSFENTAVLSYTSTPGDNPYERIGSGTDPNDYRDDTSQTVNSGDPAVDKTVLTTELASTLNLDLAIGEIITYQVVVDVPEGTMPGAKLQDTLDSGLVFVACDSIVASAALATTRPDWDTICANPSLAGSGRILTFDFGDVTNTDADNAVTEQITLTYRAVPLNTIFNDRGDTLNNLASWTWQNGAVQDSASHATLVEPTLLITKTADPVDGDGGDVVTFTLQIGHAPGSNSVAYDVAVSDALPTGLTYLPGTLVHTAGVAAAVDDSGAPTLGAAIPALAVGETSTLQFQARLNITVQPGSIVTNTADLTWTSLPGDETAPRSPYNTTSTERTGAGPDPDDYAASDDAGVTTGPGSISKALLGTNHVGTTGLDVAVGEIITYQLTITVPEGTMLNAQLADTLDSGLALVNIDAVTASPDVTASIGSFADVRDNANTALSSPGQTATLNFGTLTNANTDDAATEMITVTYRAVVLNSAGNNRGDTRGNTAVFSWIGGSLNDSAPDVTIVEPTLIIAKTVTPAAGDAGDPFTYTLTLTHTGASDANAYDVRLSDVIPAGLTYVNGSLQDASGVGASSLNESGGTISVGWDALLPGQGSAIQFQVTMDTSVEPGDIITNSADLTWTSLPTDLTTPQSPHNSVSTERTGDAGDPGGSANDYRASDDVPVTMNGAPAVAKSILTTNHAGTSGLDVAIGEIITYQVTITVPEGTLANVELADTLDSGLAFVNIDSVTASADLSTSVGTFADVRASANASLSSPGATVTLDFGTLTNANSDNTVAETITVTYRVVVLNTVGNNRGDTRGNTAVFSWTGGSLTDNAPDVTLVEPTLTIAKTAVPTTADAGDTITFTLTIAHAGGSNASAYDLLITDVVPAGLTYVPGSLTHVSGLPAAFNDSGAPALTATIAQLDTGQNSVIRFNATVDATVLPEQTITNTARLTWTSLPTDLTAPQSPHNGVSTERTGDTADPGGAANDYSAADDAAVTLTGSALGKSLDATSAAHTAGSDVTIGEVVTYALAVALPEGIVPSLLVTDHLPVGLAYVAGTAVLDAAGFNGTIAGGDPVVNSGGGSGDDVVFSFGAITVAADNDPANNTITLRFRARVVDEIGNVGLPPQTDLANTASVQIGSGAVQTTPPITVTVVEPQLQIVKSIRPNQAAAGESVTVQLVVENVGTSTAFNVELVDPLPDLYFTNISEGSTPAGFSFATEAAPPTTTVRYSGGQIAAGETVTFTFTAALTLNVINGVLITNTATVTQATTLPGPDPYERNEPDVQDDDTLAGLGPDLIVTKDDGLTQVGPGQRVTYTLTVTNSGTFTATGVTLTDTLPAHTQFVAASDGGSEAAGAVTWALGTLSPTASLTRTVTVQVDNPLPPGVTTLTNLTGVADDGARGVDPTPDNNRDDDVDDVIRIDLELGKTAVPLTANLGETITYTLTLHNRGPDTATGVTVADPLPSGMLFQSSAASQGSYDDGTAVWTVGALANGQTETLTLTALITATGAFTNVAQVETADQYDVDSVPDNDDPTEDDQDDAVITVNEAADLELQKTVDEARPNVGNDVAFTITVTNRGPDAASGVTVSDMLPAGLTYVGSSGTQGSYDNAAHLWTVGDLAVGQTETLRITVTVSVPGIFTNTAQVETADQHDTDSTPGNDASGEDDQDDATLDTRAVDLELAKWVNDAAPNLGSTITYTLSLTNRGPDTATGVTAVDSWPAGIAYASHSAGQGSYTPATGLWDVGALLANDTVTLTIRATVTATGPFTNSARVETVDQHDDDSTPGNDVPGEDDQDDAPINVPPAGDLSLDKQASTQTPNVNETVLFTLTVRNDGPDAATGIVVSDPLPVQVNYGGFTATQGSYDSGNGRWTVGDLNNGQTATLVLTTTLVGNGAFTNTAEIILSDQFDPDSTPDNDTPGEDDQDDAPLLPPLRLGNVVWYDADDDGLMDGGEPPLAGVVLELLDEFGNPVLNPVTMTPLTATTDISGFYAFENLPAGRYIVNIPAANFANYGDPLLGFISSTPTFLADDIADSNDSGLNQPDPRLTGIRSDVVTLTLQTEPVTDGVDEDGRYFDDNSNLTVDFGFFELLTLGNRVWFDADDDAVIDYVESGASGVIMNLLDQNGDPVLHPLSGLPITTTTNAAGYYLFTNLYPGDYIVQIAPQNFQSEGVLEGYRSSSGSTDPNSDADNDDNGNDGSAVATDGIRSSPVRLDYDLEPDGNRDTDDNDNTNLSVDFGLYLDPTAVQLLSFRAVKQSANTVALTWETAQEIDSYGFNLYRSASGDLADADWIHFEPTQLNGGHSAGGVYTYLDTVPAFGVWTYWLEDVDTAGETAVHAPVTVPVLRTFTLYLPVMIK